MIYAVSITLSILLFASALGSLIWTFWSSRGAIASVWTLGDIEIEVIDYPLAESGRRDRQPRHAPRPRQTHSELKLAA